VDLSECFWVEMQLPTGRRVRLEARSQRALQAELRFLAVTQSARPIVRGPVPPASRACAACRDLYVADRDAAGRACPDCADDDGS
jgi:hypothetical protein